MPHIPLEAHLPGITGLLEYRKDTAAPIRELTQFLLRGPSTLTEAERELIATIVSHRNECTFCVTAHTAAADVLLGEENTSAKVKQDITNAPVSDKMKSLLNIAGKVQVSGKEVKPVDIAFARSLGADDREIYDSILIAATFCMFNRYVDGLASFTPADPAAYEEMGKRMVEKGYVLPQSTK